MIYDLSVKLSFPVLCYVDDVVCFVVVETTFNGPLQC